MITFGLEQEFFVGEPETGDLVLCPDRLPKDEIGFLAEARGVHAETIVQAIFNLKAEVFLLNRLAEAHDVILVNEDVAVVPKEIVNRARRMYDKGRVSHRNIYGHEEHRQKAGEFVAGIHVSFKREYTIDSYAKVGNKLESRSLKYPRIFDYIQFFVAMDKAFKEEIRAAKRNPGFYELKLDGRIEYRSLPATASLDKIIEVVESSMKEFNPEY